MEDCDGDEQWMDASPEDCSEEVEMLYQQMVEGQNKVFAERTSTAEYTNEKDIGTKQAVAALVGCPQYLQWYQVCSTCHANWYRGVGNPDCEECDGFAMQRPCPVCHADTKCNSVWKRDVDMSHSFKAAHWAGKCNLPEAEQHAFMLRHLVDADPDSLADALGDLGNR